MNKLQLAYLEYSDKFISDLFYINPNNDNYDVFTDYHFLMLSMSGKHGLRPHNRKYYFNSFINSFEPIYYDGDINLSLKLSDNNDIEIFRFPYDYSFPYLDKINQKEFYENVKEKFKIRVLNFNSKDQKFLNDSFKNFIANANQIQNKISKNEKLYSNKRDIKKIRILS